MIEALFDSPVITAVATPDMWEGSLYPEEEACIPQASPKRRREFTAGRLCARQALKELGIPRFPITTADDRLPVWPPGVVGSIAHCADYCAAAVAREGVIKSLGLDIEPARPLESSIREMVCLPVEMDRLAQLQRDVRYDFSKVLFSAKESIYKCYYPIERDFLEFHDVEIHLEPSTRVFSAEFLGEQNQKYVDLGRLVGRFAVSTSHVFAGVTLFSSR